MSLIKSAGAGEQSTGFYKHLLDQSLKFDDGDAQYLTRTPASASNQKTWTWSSWVKLGRISGDMGWLWGAQGQTAIYISDGTNTSLRVNGVGGGDTATTLRLRDPSAWYHFVVAVDTTDSTAGDRLKIYVNGVRQTAFDFNTNPTLNADTNVNSTNTHIIGYRSFSSDQAFDGYLAEVNFIDGAQLTPDSFGETKNGIWTPKDTSGLTFGTNGFHLTFQDDVVSEGFNTVTYTGTGAAQSVSGVGFEPALIWVKRRDTSSYGHKLYDAVRGFSQELSVDATDGEYNLSGRVTGHSDGFDLGTYAGVNGSGGSLVAWCWEAGGAPTADNSAGAGATPTAGSVKIDGSNLGSALAGTIAATRLSANTTKGFSVGTFTKGSGNETVAHGLGAAPDWLLVKRRNGTGSWIVYHSANTANPETDYLTLNSTNATADEATFWNDTAPTSTVFTVGAAFNSGETLVFFAWTDISGYSKFGSYTGNGSTTGPTVTTGFAPAWVMYKRTSGTGDWGVLDNTRDPVNPISLWMGANIANAESHEATRQLNFLSTGFQPTGTNSDVNADGDTYIYMAFADTREAAFFKDVTTNGNHFTPVNLDYRDSVPDVPTNNFATLNALDNDSMTLSNGNLTGVSGANAHNGVGCTFGVTGGKWYWEVRSGGTGSNYFFGMGYSSFQFISQYTNDAYSLADFWAVATDGTKFGGSAAESQGELSYGSTLSEGDILQLAFDLDNGKFYAGKNGTYYASGDPAAGSNPAFTNVPTDSQMSPFYGSSTAPLTHTFNFGQDSSFGGLHATANANADANGHGSFAYAPPSGFLALCSQNLPDVAITDGTDNFNTVLWTGNGSDGRSITGAGFDPDFVWIKSRNLTTSHLLNDTIRGANKSLFSEGTTAETADNGGGYLSAFVTDGFSVTSGSSGDDAVNDSSDTYVSWNWLAGTAFSNDASATSVGTIDSEGQVNTKAGFSIISYTGNATSGATIAHGLSSVPQMLIVKRRNAANGWAVYHEALGTGSEVYLNYTQAKTNSNFWITSPTSSVFSVSASDYVNTAHTYICYAFHSVDGYSKVGSYTGNGNADGTFVYTGFRPAWIMIKWSNGSQDWTVFDNKRPGFNETDKYLHPSATAAEGDYDTLEVDLLSNGFKCRGPYNHINTSGGNYIYLAFAESPFKFANAR